MAYDGVTVVEIVLGREGLWGLRNRNLVPIGGLIQLRNATLEGASASSELTELGALAAMAAIYMGLALAALSFGLRWARRAGDLAQY